MYQLQLLNVIKIVDDERKRDMLIARGYKLVEPDDDETVADGEPEAESKDDTPVPAAGRGAARRNKEAE
ncbi:hypothetical protein M5X06_28345 [Paenibacillus alvei]|uniref:Uncharacterized protein n=1 Tax=Paenibacillus alvei TaxID=44250 RepID=A0ABT4H726_PAEAL|nr:hypothetical protein [Paenibacillus alvei]MCY9764785.1 hypothetical protein [Paenibacillus alvei]MCY9770692.1 hypothetical protein [Paenibacillus alvei]